MDAAGSQTPWHRWFDHVGASSLDGGRGIVGLAKGKGRFGRSATAAREIVWKTKSVRGSVMLKCVSIGRFVLLSLVTVCLVSPGCNKTSPIPEGVKVVGNLTLDGVEIVEAKIVFVPQTLKDDLRRDLPMAFGVTDENGNFELTLADGTREIQPTEYRVVISKIDPESNRKPILSDLKKQFPELIPDDIDASYLSAAMNEVIPPQFNEHSELLVKVESELSINTVKLHLESVDSELIEDLPLISTPNSNQ